MTETTDRTDLFGGIALGIAALAALGIANSALAPYYDALIHVTAEIRIGSLGLSKSIEHWVNDGLMAIFFLLVGLEIKREVIDGSLASVQKMVLPVVAAIGGFVVPAAIYGALNWQDARSLAGWAVPAATDIAFAIGICALLGRAVPASLKTFLLALAIIDDLLAIIVIAVFYTDERTFNSVAVAGWNRCRRTRRIKSFQCVPAFALCRGRRVHLGLRLEIGRTCNACWRCCRLG